MTTFILVLRYYTSCGNANTRRTQRRRVERLKEKKRLAETNKWAGRNSSRSALPLHQTNETDVQARAPSHPPSPFFWVFGLRCIPLRTANNASFPLHHSYTRRSQCVELTRLHLPPGFQKVVRFLESVSKRQCSSPLPWIGLVRLHSQAG